MSLAAWYTNGRFFLPFFRTRLALQILGILDSFWRMNSPIEPQVARDCLSSRIGNNAVLRRTSEVENAVQVLLKLCLPLHPTKTKNWDALRALRTIARLGNNDSQVLDVGCGPFGGVLLRWLQRLGYQNLYGCDISLGGDVQSGVIQYLKRDLENTGLPSNRFDFITSLSVIEHSIHIDEYFKEMSRLLKPGGMLLNSMDYWPETIDTSGVYPYGGKFGEMRVFSSEDIDRIFESASQAGLVLVDGVDLTVAERVVHWHNRKYTFIYFEVRKREV